MKSLLWKEWRENRALLCAIIVAALALLPVLRQFDILRAAWEDLIACQIVILVLSACIGGSLVGPEADRGTLEFLWTRPVARWRVWAAKALFGFSASMLVVGVVALSVMSYQTSSSRQEQSFVDFWPLEAALSFSAGLYVSGFVRSPLTSGLLGLGAAVACGVGLIFSPLRLHVFWPVAIAGFLIASWFTFKSSIGGNRRHGLQSAASGALIGLLLLPLVFFSGKAAARLAGPRKILEIGQCRQLLGTNRLLVGARVLPCALEPIRSKDSDFMEDVAEQRPALLDLERRTVQWLPVRDVDWWELAASGGHVIGGTAGAKDGGRAVWSIDLLYPTVANGLEGYCNVPDWSWHRKILGISPENRLIGWECMGRYHVRGELRSKLPAAELPAGTPIASTGFVNLAGRAGVLSVMGSGSVVVQYADDRADREPSSRFHRLHEQSEDSPVVGAGLRGRWLLDIAAGTAAPMLPRDAGGKPIDRARFIDSLPDVCRDWLLFATPRKEVGFCRPDGSESVLLDASSVSASALNVRFPARSHWSASGGAAVLEGLNWIDSTGTHGEYWHLDRVSRHIGMLATPGIGEASSTNRDLRVRQVIPLAGGALFACRRGEQPASELWWSAADGAAAVLVYRSTGAVASGDCSCHGVVHPFALEWLPSPTPGALDVKRVDTFRDTAGLEGCILSIPPLSMRGGAWRLLVLQPPSQGGIVPLDLPDVGVTAAPEIMPQGQRALVLQRPRDSIALVDATQAKPALKPFHYDSDPAGTHWARWASADVAVQGHFGALWALDCRTMLARKVLETER